MNSIELFILPLQFNLRMNVLELAPHGEGHIQGCDDSNL